MQIAVSGESMLPSATSDEEQIEEAHQKEKQEQEKWLLPDLVSIPTNTSSVDDKELAKFDARKVAASLLERKRLFDERWSSSGSKPDADGEHKVPMNVRYELLSFFPEEFIEPLLKNGQLNGHELPQTSERPVNVQAFVSSDTKLSDEKEKIKRLIADGMFMQQRGQCEAAIQVYQMALDLLKDKDPTQSNDLKHRISFLKEKAKDASMASARAYGWERRADLEFLHLGLKIGNSYKGGEKNFANSILPKYGIVNFLSPIELKVDRRELLHYGALIIVYKDELRFRSSFSFGDSTVLSVDKQSGRLKGPDVKSLMTLGGSKLPDSVAFVEAQVWGPIELADIKEFRIPKGRSDLFNTLAKSGIPVTYYNRDALADEPQYVHADKLGLQGLTK